MNDSTEKAQGTTSSAALRRAAPRHTSLAMVPLPQTMAACAAMAAARPFAAAETVV